MKKLYVQLFAVAMLLVCAAPTMAASGDTHVLLGKFSEGRLSASTAMTVQQSKGKSVTLKAGSYNVKISGGKLRVGAQNLSLPAAISSGGLVSWNGRSYQGQLTFASVSGGFNLGNRIDIEQYLCGVLRSEMSPSWHIEALKAQAVLARTYAIRNKGTHGTYDLCASIHCQVYGGYANDTSIRTAVTATKGVILRHGGSPAMVYYHSDSGGMVTRSGAVWGADFPYLQPLVEPFVSASPNTTWQVTLSMAQIQSKLKAGDIDAGAITSLTPVLRDESGRVEQIKITGSKGSQTIKGNRFRLLVGSTVVKSTLFEFGSRSPYNAAAVSNPAPASVPLPTPEPEPAPVRLPEITTAPQHVLTVSVDITQLPQDKEDQIVWMTKYRVFTTQELMEILSRPEQRDAYVAMGIARIKGEKPIPITGSQLEPKRTPVRTTPVQVQPQQPAGQSFAKINLSMTAATGTSVTFYGRGYGHGVGLSQWGAKAMADKGWSYDNILKHYFPGTVMAQ